MNIKRSTKRTKPDGGDVRLWQGNANYSINDIISFYPEKANELNNFLARYRGHMRIVNIAMDVPDMQAACIEYRNCRRIEKCILRRLEKLVERPVTPAEMTSFLRGGGK
jgi:hypothetical protein